MTCRSDELQLKERCRSCDGSGIYRANGWEKRCWACDGKGWIHDCMRKPVNVPKGDAERRIGGR